MKPSHILVILAAAPIAACVSAPSVPDIKPDTVLEREAVKQMFPPILASRRDTLTVGTSAQIEDHNNRVWCTFPETQPSQFDATICSDD